MDYRCSKRHLLLKFPALPFKNRAVCEKYVFFIIHYEFQTEVRFLVHIARPHVETCDYDLFTQYISNMQLLSILVYLRILCYF